MTREQIVQAGQLFQKIDRVRARIRNPDRNGTVYDQEEGDALIGVYERRLRALGVDVENEGNLGEVAQAADDF